MGNRNPNPSSTNQNPRIDVSEVKTYKSCHRKWQFSSRNAYHIVPKVAPKHFEIGTLFHEALARLYVSNNPMKVMEFVRKEAADDPNLDCLVPMIQGYCENVYPLDVHRYKVLTVEHHFEIPSSAFFDTLGPAPLDAMCKPFTICGSIDLIALDTETNKVVGFEHKTCKEFRNETYLWMDEQPRLYTVALNKYCQENGYEPGYMMLNEVKKLKRLFKHKRTICDYDNHELECFMTSFVKECMNIMINPMDNPNPDFIKCSMCDYRTVCETCMYLPVDKQDILLNFDDYQIREHDHLDEKLEVNT